MSNKLEKPVYKYEKGKKTLVEKKGKASKVKPVGSKGLSNELKKED